MKKTLPHNIWKLVLDALAQAHDTTSNSYTKGSPGDFRSVLVSTLKAEGLSFIGNGFYRSAWRYQGADGTDLVIKIQHLFYDYDEPSKDYGNENERKVYTHLKSARPDLLRFFAPLIEEYSFVHRDIVVMPFCDHTSGAEGEYDLIRRELRNAGVVMDDIGGDNWVQTMSKFIIKDYGNCLVSIP